MKPWTVLACAGMALSVCSDLSLAGDLNPPPGPVAPTMKSLDQIDPSVNLNDMPGDQVSSHRITQPGVYTFSRDVVGEPGKDGILIDCDSFAPGEHTVAISMSGFSLRGVPGTANAIFVRNSDPLSRRVHIVIDGSLRSGGGGGGGGVALISGWAIDGVHVEGASSCSIQSVRVVGCGGDGFDASRSPRSGTAVHLVTSSFESCGGNGVLVTLPAGAPSSLEIQEIECLRNGEHGARILYAPSGAAADGHSRIRIDTMDILENSLDGLYISTFGEESISMDAEDLHTARNGGSGTRLSMDRTQSRTMSVHMLRCSSNANFGDGFVCVLGTDAPNSSTRLTWDGCSSSDNNGDGFRCDFSSSANTSAVALDWDACVASGNAGNGFTARGSQGENRRASMDQCRAINNGLHGAEVEEAEADIDKCVMGGNGFGGAVFVNCPSVRANSCDMYANTLDGMRVTGGGGGGGGGAVYVFRTSLSSNGGHGLNVTDLNGDARLDLVTCYGNGGSGILFDSPIGIGCGSPTIRRCVSNGNAGSGFDLRCTTGGLVRRCEASNNGVSGFSITGLGHTVIENSASRNTQGGFIIPVPGNSVGPLTDEGNRSTLITYVLRAADSRAFMRTSVSASGAFLRERYTTRSLARRPPIPGWMSDFFRWLRTRIHRSSSSDDNRMRLSTYFNS